MEKVSDYLKEAMKIVFLVLFIVLPIRYFLFQPFIVRGASMEPSFEEADYLIVDQLSYHFRNPERGEVVVFYYPDDPRKRHIKRIIGLPGETVFVTNGEVSVEKDGETTILKEDYIIPEGETKGNGTSLREDEYFVAGDNRDASLDSRRWGALPRENIIGRVIFQISPFRVFSFLETPEY